MNETTTFRFGESEVRTTMIDGEPMFCLADVCKVLELEQVSRVKDRLNQDGVIISKVIDSMGREQQATFVSEQNLYKVIFQSRKPEAEKFTDWVTGEVLPALRKTGTYTCGRPSSSPLPDLRLSTALLIDSLNRRLAAGEKIEAHILKYAWNLLNCNLTNKRLNITTPILDGVDPDIVSVFDSMPRNVRLSKKEVYEEYRKHASCPKSERSFWSNARKVADIHDIRTATARYIIIEEN